MFIIIYTWSQFLVCGIPSNKLLTPVIWNNVHFTSKDWLAICAHSNSSEDELMRPLNRRGLEKHTPSRSWEENIKIPSTSVFVKWVSGTILFLGKSIYLRLKWQIALVKIQKINNKCQRRFKTWQFHNFKYNSL